MVSNSFCKRPLRVLLLPALLLPLWAQSSGYLTVGQPQKIVGKRGEAVETKIPLTVLSGYHVNSHTPSDEYLIPLKLTWTSAGALEGGEIRYPKPSMEQYEFAPKPLSVYTGSFDLIAQFKVAPHASAGPGAIVGKLRYQACSNKACYPPKTIEVTVPYHVQ